jgi:hypothetical protein
MPVGSLVTGFREGISDGGELIEVYPKSGRVANLPGSFWVDDRIPKLILSLVLVDLNGPESSLA